MLAIPPEIAREIPKAHSGSGGVREPVQLFVRASSCRGPPARDHRRGGKRVAAPLQRRLGLRGPVHLGGDPLLGLLEERVHLCQERADGRTLALQRLDPPQPPKDSPGLVHAGDGTGEIRTRV
jgi:hypothetical protein